MTRLSLSFTHLGHRQQLLQPKFSAYLSTDQRIAIRDQVQRVIDVLGSPEIAMDDRHAPKLYSRFLAGLLATPLASIDHTIRNAITPSTTTSGVPSPAQGANVMQDAYVMLDDAPRESMSPSPLLSSPPAFSPKPAPPASFSLDVFADTPSSTETYTNEGVTEDVSNLTYAMSPPLPFDNELLQTMQSQGVWPSDMILPGECYVIDSPGNRV